MLPSVRWLCPGPRTANTDRVHRRKKEEKQIQSGGMPVCAFPIHRPAHRTGGKRNAGSGLNRRTLSKNKMRQSQDEISGSRAVLPPIATGNRSPLHIPYTAKRRGNTDLLTCVRERQSSCVHCLPSHRSSLQWRTFVPAVKNRFGVTSRAQHRFVSVLRPSSDCLSCPRACGIGVYYGISIFSFTEGDRP